MARNEQGQDQLNSFIQALARHWHRKGNTIQLLPYKSCPSRREVGSNTAINQDHSRGLMSTDSSELNCEG